MQKIRVTSEKDSIISSTVDTLTGEFGVAYKDQTHVFFSQASKMKMSLLIFSFVDDPSGRSGILVRLHD